MYSEKKSETLVGIAYCLTKAASKSVAAAGVGP